MRSTLARLLALAVVAAHSGCDGGPIAPDGGVVEAVEISPPAPQVEAGGSLQLSATPRDAEGNALSGREVFWTSENEAIARVSPGGMVTGETPGTVRIAASTEGTSGITTVTVVDRSVAAVAVAPAQARIPVRATLQLQATAYDATGRVLPGQAVEWTSSDPAVVTVDGSGVITAVRPGTATVTAASAGRRGRAEITVITGSPARVVAAGGEGQSGAVGAPLPAPLAVRVTDADGNPIAGVAVAWSVTSGGGSVRPLVAPTNAEGISTAEWTLGTPTGIQTAAAEVAGLPRVAFAATARAGTVASVTVEPSSATLDAPGATRQLTAVARDAAGNVVQGTQFSWISSNESVATVDAAGTVTGKSPGTATITAAAEGKSATATVTVLAPSPPPPAPVGSVTVSPSTGEVQVGGTLQLTGTPRDAAGSPLSGRTVTWQSSAPGIATVDGDGTVTGVAPGQATITATSEGKSGTASITVKAPPPPPPEPVASVTVSPSTGEVQVGGTLQLSATTRDAAGNPLSGRTVTWQSSAPGIATVDGDGTVTGVAPGQATITATSEGKSGTAVITVKTPPPPPPEPVASVTVSPSTGEVQVGGTLQLSATTRDAAGNVLAGRTVTWQSSAPGIATVDASGKVTGVAPGQATITATSEGKSGTATITVTTPPPGPPATVTVSPDRAKIEEDETVQLTATVRDAAGNVLTGYTVTWSSSRPDVASVDETGRVRGKKEGEVTITAAVEGKRGTATVEVEDD